MKEKNLLLANNLKLELVKKQKQNEKHFNIRKNHLIPDIKKLWKNVFNNKLKKFKEKINNEETSFNKKIKYEETALKKRHFSIKINHNRNYSGNKKEYKDLSHVFSVIRGHISDISYHKGQQFLHDLKQIKSNNKRLSTS